jgi:hypothetical protein
MFGFIELFSVKKLTFIQIILFFLVLVSGVIHIYFFNSEFNVYFFEFLRPTVFSDFQSVLAYSGLENPYNKESHLAPANYPPFAYLILRPLSNLNFMFAYCVYLSIVFSLLFLTFYKLKKTFNIDKSKAIALLFFIIFSHPFLFALFRGNLDLLVGVLLINILNFDTRTSILPGILVGIAGAIKIVPLAFCILFLALKNYKSLFICILTFTLLSFFSLYCYGLSLPAFYNYFSHEYALYKDLYVIGNMATNFFSDPWLIISGFFKLLDHSNLLVQEYYEIYNFAQIFLMCFLTYFVIKNRDNISEIFIILLIGMMMIGFPAPSNDYKILYMLPGVLYYLVYLDEKRYTHFSVKILGTFTVLMFIHFSFFYLLDYISVSSFIRPIFYIISISCIAYLFCRISLKKDRLIID